MLFKKYLGEFREVYKLAKERREVHNSRIEENDIENMIGIKITANEITARENLEKYLESLDFEIIKVIQTIMYLGRDKDYNKKFDPKKIYLNERKYFDHNIGWKSKTIEINQIVEKVPLDKYLEEGFEILKIRL